METAGKVGAIYYRKARIQGTGIAFVENGQDTITDTGDGFVDAGFESGDHITVSGSTSNDGTYLIDTVAVGTLTLDSNDTLTDEVAGDNVTIIEAAPGTQIAGFYNWSLHDGVDLADITDFGDVGIEKSIPTINRWSATAEKYWQTDSHQEAWLGSEKTVRFFTLYDGSPDITTVYYFEGNAFISGIDTNTPVGEVITQTLTFQGSAWATIQGTGIAFVDSGPDTITDTGSRFLTAGFAAGDRIKVWGSTNNDGDYTIASVTAGTITLVAADTLTVETAGAQVLIATLPLLKTRATAWPTGGP